MNGSLETTAIDTAICPWCREETSIVFDEYVGRYCVECSSCGMRSPFRKNPIRAANLWNRILERLEEGMLE